MKLRIRQLGLFNGLWGEAAKSIRSMRKDAGLTQSQLGKKLIPIVDQATISNWETGKTPVPLTSYFLICFICGFSPEEKTKQLLESQQPENKRN
ncbi:helix-turn-helix domain-containing protein [Pseudoalteromonas luteoviolacea]|uniref:HTH cro/C1-type domain-containing protein n=1 Tax=Pseudoalteromonas luteoviolacea NCIMB 1942 TaxID=1365253 RepID=A0A162A1M5_9GAMM|nr:helix-turn-helix transcriptional regulator [Pseudoalteromonas luteoviolacea]KZN41509.1 hypothetical protein N482_20335 [Pseudoalteromonas luteoviolacea NCIMB 1942]